MEVEEHIRAARSFLAASEVELEAGDELQASEKLWGAAAHALRAVLHSEGRPHGKRRELREAAMRMSAERGDSAIAAGFAVTDKFHANFYHGFMEEDDIRSERVVVREFVDRILNDRPRTANSASSPAGPGGDG